MAHTAETKLKISLALKGKPKPFRRRKPLSEAHRQAIARSLLAKSAEAMVRGVKYCPRCQTEKPMSEFAKCNQKGSGLSGWCRECNRVWLSEYRRANVSNPDYRRLRREGQRRWREAHPERYRKAQRRHLLNSRYGLSLEEYERMLSTQGGVCAICLLPPETAKNRGRRFLDVDHDHATNEVRGLLCANCNETLAGFLDDPQRFIRAAEYLKAKAELPHRGR